MKTDILIDRKTGKITDKELIGRQTLTEIIYSDTNIFILTDIWKKTDLKRGCQTVL